MIWHAFRASSTLPYAHEHPAKDDHGQILSCSQQDDANAESCAGGQETDLQSILVRPVVDALNFDFSAACNIPGVHSGLLLLQLQGQ